jgi:catalase-peroxidase
MLKLVVLLALTLTQSAFAMEKRDNTSNQFWWPELLSLAPLRQHAVESNPMGKTFN